jgi:hypothetical protein
MNNYFPFVISMFLFFFFFISHIDECSSEPDVIHDFIHLAISLWMHTLMHWTLLFDTHLICIDETIDLRQQENISHNQYQCTKPKPNPLQNEYHEPIFFIIFIFFSQVILSSFSILFQPSFFVNICIYLFHSKNFFEHILLN